MLSQQWHDHAHVQNDASEFKPQDPRVLFLVILREGGLS